MKLSLCIEPVFKNIDFYDRIQLAADLGFDAIECWDVATRNHQKIAQLAIANRLEIAICCVKDAWNNRMDGESGRVMANIRESIAIIKDMGCDSLIVLAGDMADGETGREDILAANLQEAGILAKEKNVTLCLEALNSTVDHKGYSIDSSQKAFKALEHVPIKNVKILYDIYHMQIMEGNITKNILDNVAVIGHIHSAGVPGRHEIMDGELDYGHLIGILCKSGYNGFFGLEYWPSYEDSKSLSDSVKFFRTYAYV